MVRSIGFDFWARDNVSPAADSAADSVTELGRAVDRASGTVEVDVDDADVARAEAGIARLNAKKIRIDATIDDVQRQIRILEYELTNATEDRQVEINADLTQLRSKLDALKNERVAIDLDTKAAQAELAQLKNRVDEVDDSTRRGGGGLDAFTSKFDALNEGVEAVTMVVQGFGAAVEHAVTITMSRANAQVALGAEGYSQLEATANATAHAMGQTTSEFIRTGGQVAILAKNLGFTSEEASRFGGQLPKVADNLALLSSGTLSSAEASDVLRSALAGEYDPLQAVGIAISQEIVNQEKANIVKQRGASVTDLQANALAVMSIVQRQTATATEVANTAAGQQAIAIESAKAQLKEMGDTIVTSVLPAVGAMAESFNESAKVIQDDNAGWAEKFVAINRMNPVYDALYDKMSGATGATKAAMFADDAAAQAAAELARKNDEAALAFSRLRDAAEKQANAVLDSREAARQYQAAIDDAAAANKRNGDTLDISTAKGRENQAALDGIAAAALRQARSVLDAGGSQKQFDGIIASSRSTLVSMAQQFGMTESQAKAYANQVLNIPASKMTKITADTSQAMSAINSLKTAIVNINGKTVTIRTVYESVYISTGKTTTIAKSAGGPIPWIPGARAGVDSVPVLAEPDEYMIRAVPARRFRPLLDAINNGTVPALSASTVAAGLRVNPTAGGAGETHVHYHANLQRAVIGDDQHLAKTVVTAMRSAVESGLLPRKAATRE